MTNPTMTAPTTRLVVGDVGGTNARFGVAAATNGHLELRREATLPSGEFSSMDDALRAFLELCPEARGSEAACFGIAGPVRGDRCEATNLGWSVEGRRLARILELPAVTLLNDLEAAAWGLVHVGAAGIRTLVPGDGDGDAAVDGGHRAILAAGTGLGEAFLYWDGREHRPCATEGGHGDLAPQDELQVELWRHLAARYGHVSWERAVSGPGLENLFTFLLERAGKAEPEWFVCARETGRRRGGDAAAAIARHADDGCEVSTAALDLFFALLGAEAGNLALRTLATGGLYLAGGIVPKLLPRLVASPFLAAYAAKGRFRSLVESIPVHVVTDPRLGLWGAASRAALVAEGAPAGVPA